jgi:hypothetical protein
MESSIDVLENKPGEGAWYLTYFEEMLDLGVGRILMNGWTNDLRGSRALMELDGRRLDLDGIEEEL